MATGKIRSIGAFCVWLLLLFAAGEVHPSGDGLDLQAELSRPGVKLLVVEFYATWCEPCQEAVPKWKKLHDKYGPKGLRFIVVSVGDDGQCSNPGWSPDRNVCDVDGTIQAEWDVANLPQAFLYSWQGDLLAERAHVEPVEDAIERFFKKTQLSLYVDEIDTIGDKYAVGSNPAWLKKHISSQIRKQSKFDVVKYRNAPAYTKSDHCAASFPANSNLRIQVQGDERGNRTLTLEIEKDGCVLASNQKPYTGKGFQEDRESLTRAADEAVRELLAAVIRIKKPRPPQVFERAGFGEGLDDLQGLRGESGKLRGMSRLEIPKGSMADFDTDYMDLLVAATNVDKSDKKTVDEKIVAWQKVASYSKKTFARDKAERRIKEWQSWQEARVNKAVALKKAFAQYKEDKEKLAKILSYPEDFVSKQQKQAYENEFNRAYRDVKDELEQIAKGKHELMSLIDDENLVSGNIEWVYSRPAKLHFMKTEATLDQFKACVEAGACKEKNRRTKSENKNCNWGYSDRDDHPMNCVDWYGAKDFCEWAGGRLPTEEEWFSEASNHKSREYPWGDQKATCDYAIMDNGTDGCGKNSTWPVCSKPRGNSVSGLCDMGGNVWEWTSSLYKSGSSTHTLRGGALDNSSPSSFYSSSRVSPDLDLWFHVYGFRCVRSTKP